MNYRVQLFPSSALRELQTPSTQNDALNMGSADRREAEYYGSWAVSELDFGPSRFNGNSLLGLALAFGIAAGFWTAAGLVIARLW